MNTTTRSHTAAPRRVLDPRPLAATTTLLGLLASTTACDQLPAPEASPTDPIADRAAVADAMFCWARGMDLTIAGLADEGQAEWESCYAGDDYEFTILFAGQVIEGEGAAGRRMTNVQTAGMFGYEYSQHYVTNLDIDIAGSTATATALQKADHFLPDLTVETTWGVITVEFQREDGQWRASSELMDIQRFVAFPGLAAPTGAGGPMPMGQS